MAVRRGTDCPVLDYKENAGKRAREDKKGRPKPQLTGLSMFHQHRHREPEMGLAKVTRAWEKRHEKHSDKRPACCRFEIPVLRHWFVQDKRVEAGRDALTSMISLASTDYPIQPTTFGGRIRINTIWPGQAIGLVHGSIAGR